MKTFINFYFTLFTLVFAINVNSQIPSYTLEAKNGIFAPDLKSFTFELVINHTNASTFEYAGGQYFFKIPQSIGDLGVGVGTNSGYVFDSVAGQPVSDFPQAFWPRNPSVAATTINGIPSYELRLAANSLPGAGNGLILPQNDPKLIMRMKIRTLNGTQLNPNVVDFFFRDSCSDNPVSGTRTKINVYIGTFGTEITRCANHFVFTLNALNLISPENNSFDNYFAINFTWNRNFNSKTFRLLISKNVNLTDIFYDDSTLTDTTKYINGFDADKKYYWVVTGKDSLGNLFNSHLYSFTTKKYLISPRNDSSNAPVKLNFQWSKVVINVLNYQLQIATDSAMSNLIFEDSALTDTSKVVDRLHYYTRHYWRVTTKDSLNNIYASNIQSFFTTGQLVSPPNNANNFPGIINFIWRRDLSSAGYFLEISKDSLLNNIVITDSTITDTSKFISGLEFNTKYFWRIKTKDLLGNIFTSNSRNVKTVRQLISPDSSATNVANPTTFIWHKNEYASIYTLQIASDPFLNNIVYTDSTITDTIKAVSNLQFETIYYWRIKTKNTNGVTFNSAIWNYKTEEQLVSPANNENGVSIPTTFSWHKNINVSGYILKVATDPLLNNLLFDSTITDTFKVISGLDFESQYYWSLEFIPVSDNSSGYSDLSYPVIRNFTTWTFLASPGNFSYYNGSNINFEWHPVQNNLYYRLQVFSNQALTQMIVNDSIAGATTRFVTGFSYYSTYYWRVFAIDNSNNTYPSPIWRFSVNDIPAPIELSSFVSIINKNDVTLKWTTATEENNSGFEIERSIVNSEWSKINFVKGNGNSNTQKNYSYNDRNLTSGNYNYRLKQIDNNGNFTYFNLNEAVIVGVPVKYGLSQNYPNPFNPSTKINFELPFDGNISLKIYDISGKEISTLVNEFKIAGYYTVNFKASDLASGIYFYTINAKNFNSTKKMVLMK